MTFEPILFFFFLNLYSWMRTWCCYSVDDLFDYIHLGRRVNTAGLRLLSLGRARLQVCLLARLALGWRGNLASKLSSEWILKLFLNDKGSSLYLSYLYSGGLCWTAGFLLGVWNFSTVGYLYDQSPIKTLDTEFLMSFPDRQHFICVAITRGWRN